MATQLKPIAASDAVEARQRRVPTTLHTTTAASAVAQALNAIPDGVKSARLDELAASLPHAEADTPLRDILAMRAAAFQNFGDGKATDAELGILGQHVRRLESTIFARPAGSASDAYVKLLTIAQIAIDGGDPEPEEVADAVESGRRYLDVITTADAAKASVVTSENSEATPSLRDMLRERNDIMATMDSVGSTATEEEDGAACDRIALLDGEILGRAATCAEDAIVKLLMLAQISAEGHQPDEEEAQGAVRAAKRFLGAGYLYEGGPAPADVTVDRLPEGYNQWMSGPYIQWQSHYAQVENVRSERIAYERDIFEPAYQRYNAVRSLWPWNYDLAADPKAQAALAAVDCMEESTRRDALRDQEHDAIESLLRCTAPGPAELATKLKLWQQEEGYDLNSAREIVDVLVSDARRFGSHGPFLQSDADLLAAFDTYRAGLTQLGEAPSIGQTDEQHEEACYARMDPAAETMLEKRANTLEGVLAKMRHGLMVLGSDNWVPDVVTAPGSQRLAAGIAVEGMYERMLWSAFQDLARIAGVSLTEQAA